jgi:NAD(P)-dependent dehydrogenase (short-subunit alcohol dehydrogenase family)
MDVRVDGKVALVTGASRGIGRAISQGLFDSGARVLLSSRKRDALDVAAEEIIRGSAVDRTGDVAVFAANAGDPDQAAACVAATMERFGRIDILVNNAATNPHFGPTLDIDVGKFDKTIAVNLRGPLVWTQQVVAASMREHGGTVINIASVGALLAEPSLGIYNATKAALIHLTQTLAAELAPGVRVNAIAPGLVKTDMARALWEADEAGMSRMVPLGRLGEPDDIAAAAVFLASDAASWITGHTLVVDGGMLLH